MNSYKREANLEELRERYWFVCVVFSTFNINLVVTTCLLHCCMGPGAVRRVQTAKCLSGSFTIPQTKENALHWASTVGLWNDIFGYICTLCRQVAPVYFLEVSSIKMQKHSLHNCLLES